MLKAHRFLTICLCLAALLAGCSSHPSLSDFNYPITSIYSAVTQQMTMGIQHWSDNHREAYSKPFVVNQPERTKNVYRERGLATVKVLGDSRPYTLEVDVVIERAMNRGKNAPLSYEVDRHDDRLARVLLMNIKNQLESRSQNQNLIDDFRPF